jgi:hypothetical protein
MPDNIERIEVVCWRFAVTKFSQLLTMTACAVGPNKQDTYPADKLKFFTVSTHIQGTYITLWLQKQQLPLLMSGLIEYFESTSETYNLQKTERI